MAIAFAQNPRYEMSNGLSVLAARSAVGANNFFLSMSDHMFESALILGLSTVEIPEHGLVLAVDRKLDRIYDMDDATKVRSKDGRIVAINKRLDEFDAVDTGLFACSPGLFEAIERASLARPDRDCSLSDGVKALAADGLAWVYDVGDGMWQDVDTPGALDHAEKLFGRKK